MALGQGFRKIGEPCWSHAQCRRGDENSYCDFLVCKCENEFHNIDGKCSRNYWEDLGLQNWQLLVIALITTLFFLAVFIGCTYYVFLTIVRKYRRTRPSGELAPSESFKDKGAGKKRDSVMVEGQPDDKVAETKHSLRRKSQRAERTRAYLRREMDILREKEEEEEEEEEKRESSTSTQAEAQDIFPTTSIRPLTKFILPLHYSHGHAGSGEGEGGQQRNLRRSSSFGSWSLSSWEMEPLEAGLDWWPARRQFRRPAHRGEPAKTLRPLILHASASEESDEEV